jgi:haloalkane dehalogenase
MPPQGSPAEYPFHSRWLTLEDGALHYVDEGSGFPVLMLHGNPTWSFLYRNVIQGLWRDFRCVAPDYPGFGHSRAPRGYGFTPQEHASAISRLLDRLGLDPYILLCHDWGGPIGISAALASPGKVAGLVLCNTWCWPPDARARLFSWVMGGPAGRLLNLRFNFFARVVVPAGIKTRAARSRSVLQAYAQRFPAPADRLGTYVFPRMIRKAAPWLRETRQRLPGLADTPAELVWGMRDPVFGRQPSIDRWIAHFPQAGLDRVPYAGHYVPEDAPERLIRAVRRVSGRL